MKPDWKDSPNWAEFLAQDECGEWYWYELEPKPSIDRFSGMGKIQLIENTDWKSTLEKRP